MDRQHGDPMLFCHIFCSLFISHRGNGEPQTLTYTQLRITQAQSFYILGLWIHDNSFQFVIFKPLSLVCKASSVASNQTRWYSKKKLRKSYLVPRNFSSIENYKLFRLYQKIHKLVNKSQLINLEKICSIVFFNNQLWYWHHKESASIFF